jgi:glutaredoxin 3
VARDSLPAPLSRGLEAGSELLAFSDGTAFLELAPLPPGVPLDRAVATGRWATETEDGAPAKVADAVKASGGGQVLHGPIKLQPHGEEVTIAQDGDGHEFCFVDARGYRNCTAVAHSAGGRTVDWAYRGRLAAAAALTGEAARAGVAGVMAGDYDVSAVCAQIDAAVASSPVVLYSQTSCPYCKKSKELLAAMGVAPTVVELDAMGSEGHAVRAELAKRTGRSSVPAIFVGGQFVGGFSDGPGLATLSERGELEGMLRKAGAL